MTDIVCLVETWLCMDILDMKISIPNYSIVRLDRNRHGGGVAMYIRNSVSYNVVLYMAPLVWKSLLYHYLKVILNCVCIL